MKLYMFYVGGSCGNSNIELHDVRFSIGENVEACFPDLGKQWWGDPKSLHLDCWGAVEQADGFDVEVTSVPVPPSEDHLFFANMGGYQASEFAELHHNVLLVAPNAPAAKKRAMAMIKHWSLPHKDNVFEVENLIDISAATANYGYRLRLTKATTVKPFEFSCDYLPIAKKTKRSNA